MHVISSLRGMHATIASNDIEQLRRVMVAEGTLPTRGLV